MVYGSNPRSHESNIKSFTLYTTLEKPFLRQRDSVVYSVVYRISTLAVGSRARWSFQKRFISRKKIFVGIYSSFYFVFAHFYFFNPFCFIVTSLCLLFFILILINLVVQVKFLCLLF
jgi:hypothetical protein